MNSYLSHQTLIFNVLVLFGAIIIHNSQRNRSYLHRNAIVDSYRSSWVRLFENGDNSSFVEIIGMNRQTFAMLKEILWPNVLEIHTIRRGRPSLLDENGKLGLFLIWSNSMMRIKHISMIFGITPSVASDVISNMLYLLCEKLKIHPISRISYPNIEKMAEYAAMINRREPKIRNVTGFVDGLKLPVQCGEDPKSQDRYYNGFCGDTVVNNVLAFAPTGKIIYATINCPGSWHDSTAAYGLIGRLLKDDHDYAFCVDSGFPRSGALEDRFVGPISRKRRRQLSDIVADAILERYQIYVSLRQASEWGMRALQGTFSRLRSRLTSDSYKRHQTILAIILLNNFRTEVMGLNQIAAVFNPEYEQYIKLHTYDRIRRYFY